MEQLELGSRSLLLRRFLGRHTLLETLLPSLEVHRRLQFFKFVFLLGVKLFQVRLLFLQFIGFVPQILLVLFHLVVVHLLGLHGLRDHVLSHRHTCRLCRNFSRLTLGQVHRLRRRLPLLILQSVILMLGRGQLVPNLH